MIYFYICDKGYIDYERFNTYTNKDIYFVSRLKDNAKLTVIKELPITPSEEENGLLAKNSVIVFDKKFVLVVNTSILQHRLIEL